MKHCINTRRDSIEPGGLWAGSIAEPHSGTATGTAWNSWRQRASSSQTLLSFARRTEKSQNHLGEDRQLHVKPSVSYFKLYAFTKRNENRVIRIQQFIYLIFFPLVISYIYIHITHTHTNIYSGIWSFPPSFPPLTPSVTPSTPPPNVVIFFIKEIYFGNSLGPPSAALSEWGWGNQWNVEDLPVVPPSKKTGSPLAEHLWTANNISI